MDKKLTLSINQEIIAKAKHYAKSNNTSLSKMIESYFEALTNKESQGSLKTTPLVESLCGVIDLPRDFDYKASRVKRLIKKHK